MERRGNGFGTLVSKGVGKPFLAKWLYHGKTYYKSTGEVDRKKALKVLEKLTRPFRESDEAVVISNLEAMLKRLKASIIETKKLAIKDIWSEFEKTLWQSNLQQGTLKQYKMNLQHMTSWMSGKALDASGIDVKLAELYLKELSSKVSAEGFNLRISLFKRVWHALPKEYGIDCSVWDGFKKHKDGMNIRRQALTTEQLAEIVANAPTEDIKLLLLIGTYTGLRIGDCANLKWSDIDMEANTMRVLPQKTKKHMDAPITIPLHPTLRAALAEAKHGESEYVSETNACEYASGHLSKEVTSMFRRCGIQTSIVADGKRKLICGFHSLRHTFVSMAISIGMSPLLVQKIVGHSSVNMTEHYFHENASKASEGISQMPDIVAIAQHCQRHTEKKLKIGYVHRACNSV